MSEEKKPLYDLDVKINGQKTKIRYNKSSDFPEIELERYSPILLGYLNTFAFFPMKREPFLKQKGKKKRLNLTYQSIRAFISFAFFLPIGILFTVGGWSLMAYTAGYIDTLPDILQFFGFLSLLVGMSSYGILLMKDAVHQYRYHTQIKVEEIYQTMIGAFLERLVIKHAKHKKGFLNDAEIGLDKRIYSEIKEWGKAVSFSDNEIDELTDIMISCGLKIEWIHKLREINEKHDCIDIGVCDRCKYRNSPSECQEEQFGNRCPLYDTEGEFRERD